MLPKILNEQILTPAFQLMADARFDKPQARVQAVAIALQETALRNRIQQPNGPARSYWQFERNGGVAEVMVHAATGPRLRPIVTLLNYNFDKHQLHDVMAHNDLLAACMARLLIYIDPRPLPTTAAQGWEQYLARWRPGKPHKATWQDNWDNASRIVLE